MRDLEQPDKQDDDDGDEEGEEPEHGMGDLDDENQEVVDERLWDKEEDDHLKPQGDEKVERDAVRTSEKKRPLAQPPRW
jgi:midasin